MSKFRVNEIIHIIFICKFMVLIQKKDAKAAYIKKKIKCSYFKGTLMKI